MIKKPLLVTTALFACMLPVSLTFSQEATVPETQAMAADAQTTSIVAAGNAFLDSLTAEQRTAALFDFKDAKQRARWSNFPLGIFERAGVAWGDLTDDQRDALKALLGTILSPRGVTMVEQQMAADDVLAAEDASGSDAAGAQDVGAAPPVGSMPTAGTPPAGGSGGPGGQLTFGSDYYYVSFLGEPSATSPWMLQFGGHHLAINATVVGGSVTLAPSLTGGQPVKFTLDGQDIYIVEDEVTAATALIEGLTDEQRDEAVVSTDSIDLVLGPGKDGMTLQPEGLPVADMTEDEQALLLALVEARLGIMDLDDLAPKLADIEANLDESYFAWFGPVENPGASYWRVTGPTIIMEFSPQTIGGDKTNHLHNMYRDPTNEYGAAWTALE